MNESDEEEPDERPPFRWNRPAVLVVVFTAAAVAIPLGGVVWMLRGGEARPAPPPPARAAKEDPGLRAMLERASGALAVAPIPDGRPTLSIPAASEAERAAKVQKLRDVVRGQGGTIVEMEPGRRFLVAGPKGARGAVCGALLPEQPTPAEAGAEIFEVRFP